MKTIGMEIRNDRLYLNNIALTSLVKKYKGPVYVFDEKHLRYNLDIFKNYFKDKKINCIVEYASKAYISPYLLNVLKEYNFCVDFISLSDLKMIEKSGFDLSKTVMNGNNKSEEELKLAIKLGVGKIIIDNITEFKLLVKLAKGKKVHTLFRVNPGIDTHTHEYVQTSKYASKFGESIFDKKVLKRISELYKNNENIIFEGFHAHIGSQIADEQAYIKLANIMKEFMEDFEKDYELVVKTINLGGGFSIKYKDEDKEFDLKNLLKDIIMVFKSTSLENLIIEPGRCIVGDCCFTLYNVGAVKQTYGKVNYVFVDGGMSDNIRPALYQAKYTIDCVNKINDEKTIKYDVAGKLCESGDFIGKDIMLPKIRRGDVLIVYCTGAYCFSMSSNYNGLPKGAVIFVGDKINVASRREKSDDILKIYNFKEVSNENI